MIANSEGRPPIDPPRADLRDAGHELLREARALGRATQSFGQIAGAELQRVMHEHTDVTLGAALSAGFVVGGGLSTPVGRVLMTAARRFVVGWMVGKVVEPEVSGGGRPRTEHEM